VKKILKENIYLLLTFAVSFILFFRSLFVFFTNDDFFHLKIAQIHGFTDFIKFFYVSPEGWGLYRPIGTQVFYALGLYLFNMQPFWMHAVLFGLFFLTIFLVQRLIFELTENKTLSFIAVFLYATSATHFGQLYFLATQELWVSVFYLASVLFFVLCLKKSRTRLLIFSLAAFILALMSKEIAVSLPLILTLLYWFKRGLKDLKAIFKLTVPYWLVLLAYFIFRFKFYGFTSGVSYVWDFSARMVNTLGWYGLWSLNLPEMLVDFIGPGLKLNPNLFLYWGSQYRTIFVLFALELALILAAVIGKRKEIKKFISLYSFGILWFAVTLLPVLFLPLHKFAFYLTIPLLGLVLILGQLLSKQKIQTVIFILVWLTISIVTLNITRQTHWITQGENLSGKALQYFQYKKEEIGSKKIYLVDTKEDSALPWSPTTVVRQALSDKNFFYVFFPKIAGNINYQGTDKLPKTDNIYIINSRVFLGY
jgi:hypothetical protein